MPPEEPVNPAPAAPPSEPARAAAPAAPATPPAAEREAQLAEVRRHVRGNNLGQQLEDQLITALSTGASTVEQVNQRILTALAERSNAQPVESHVRMLPGTPDLATREAVSAALLHRERPHDFQLPEAGRRWRTRSLLEIGRSLLEARSIRTDHMGVAELAERTFTSSDFPFITADVANKELQRAYKAKPRNFTQFAKRGSLRDFKNKYTVQVGEVPKMQEVPVGGEIKFGSMKEARESFRLRTYASGIAFSRELLINDDLGAFLDLSAGFGMRAVQVELDTVWGLLIGAAGLGVVMSDTKTVFHADHGNYITGANTVLSVEGIGLLAEKAFLQKMLDGETPMSVELRHLCVPARLALRAQQLVTKTNVAKDGDVNPYDGQFDSVTVEGRLDAVSTTAWLAIARPSEQGGIEYAYLDGAEGVHVETQPTFDTLGIKIRAMHDFGAGVTDHRGLYRSKGAA